MALFICKNCGYGSASWMGRCPDCGQWDTLSEKSESKKGGGKGTKLKLTPLSKIETGDKKKMLTGLFELDRVLGGGIVSGESILITGEPGVGKSTLLLQSLKNLKTIYISGEESGRQVTDRAKRLKINLTNLMFSDQTEVEGIKDVLENQDGSFDVLVIDSIQTLYLKRQKLLGKINQLKESVALLTKLSRDANIAIIFVGHVTKQGTAAGPKTVEHLVDCVLTFEGDKVSSHRILRATKNRFGTTDEIGIFEMGQEGLMEVNDPLAFLEDQQEALSSGKAVVGVIEGRRPLFFEIQSLATPTTLAYPRRIVKGVDYNKVQLLIAVIQKQLGIPLERFDIYVNVVGGVTIKSTAADFGIISSILSSVKNFAIPKKNVFVGEIGLLGETRKVTNEEKIITEARRLGFRRIFSSKNTPHIKELRKTLF